MLVAKLSSVRICRRLPSSPHVARVAPEDKVRLVVLHEVLVLAQERMPAGLLGRLRELVRAILSTPTLDLAGLEAGLRIDAEPLADLLGGKRVPRDRVTIGEVEPSFPSRRRSHQTNGTARGYGLRRPRRACAGP